MQQNNHHSQCILLALCVCALGRGLPEKVLGLAQRRGGVPPPPFGGGWGSPPPYSPPNCRTPLGVTHWLAPAPVGSVLTLCGRMCIVMIVIFHGNSLRRRIFIFADALHQVIEHGLVLVVVDAEYQFDRKKLTFYYDAAERCVRPHIARLATWTPCLCCNINCSLQNEMGVCQRPIHTEILKSPPPFRRLG